MTKCSECGNDLKSEKCGGGGITGKDMDTGKTKTLCWNCFDGKYEFVKGVKHARTPINAFRKRKP